MIKAGVTEQPEPLGGNIGVVVTSQAGSEAPGVGWGVRGCDVLDGGQSRGQIGIKR